MRKGVTLIELVLSMVIVALVFTVIPKIIIATNKSFVSASKQDGIFNAVELMHTISSSPWDAKSYETFNILNVDESHTNLECNASSGYRPGGFIGGRNCLGAKTNATDIDERNTTAITAIEDFHTFDFDANDTKCLEYTRYGLQPRVQYNTFDTFTPSDINLSSDLVSTANDGNESGNIKYVSLSVSFDAAGQNSVCMDFDYYSTNLGQTGIERKVYE